jgi:ubiquinone/menaquinone biosynthesis C-methylase UbiE
MSERPVGYVPAAGSDFLLPLYDPFLRFVMREHTFKRRLVAEAAIEPGLRVLDLGCGTATLTMLAKRLHPEAELVGVDGDPKVLEIARRKVADSGLAISLDQALATELPYPDDSFDRVLSCLVFHHLTREEKLRALAEVRRVLRPGGRLHVVDFGPPGSRLERALTHFFHHGDRLDDNLAGRLPALFTEAGFRGAEQTGRQLTPGGVLAFVRGTR